MSLSLLCNGKVLGLSLTCYNCYLDIGTMTIESVPHPFLYTTLRYELFLLYGHLLLVRRYTGKNQILDTIINGSGDTICWNQIILLEYYHIMQVYLMSCIELNLHTSQKYLGERLNRCRSIVFVGVFIMTPIYRRKSLMGPLVVWSEIKTFCWNITISCMFT